MAIYIHAIVILVYPILLERAKVRNSADAYILYLSTPVKVGNGVVCGNAWAGTYAESGRSTALTGGTVAKAWQI